MLPLQCVEMVYSITVYSASLYCLWWLKLSTPAAEGFLECKQCSVCLLLQESSKPWRQVVINRPYIQSTSNNHREAQWNMCTYCACELLVGQNSIPPKNLSRTCNFNYHWHYYLMILEEQLILRGTEHKEEVDIRGLFGNICCPAVGADTSSRKEQTEAW